MTDHTASREHVWKRRARMGLVIIAGLTVFSAWRAAQIGFNYDF